MRYSLGVLKPDCLERGLETKALDLVRRRGLRVVFEKRMLLSREDAELLYEWRRGAVFFEDLIEFMISCEVLLFIVKSEDGVDAIGMLNSVTGHTVPAKAKPFTLRSMGTDIRRNISHSTADGATFWAAVQHFLTEAERRQIGLGRR